MIDQKTEEVRGGEPERLKGEQLLKAGSYNRLKEKVKKMPVKRMKRLPRVQYRSLRKAPPRVWREFLKLCEEYSQDHAKLMLENDCWDVDWSHDYLGEIMKCMDRGDPLGTEHSPRRRDGKSAAADQEGMKL